jgi:DNA-binding transcriptional LysR family regulator
MTLGQLQSFVTVARLGSVKAAARALGVSEPAVSLSVAALRRDLGDPLYVRAGGGIALTPGGRRLVALASEIVELAEQARRAADEKHGGPALLRVAATSAVAEHVASPLLEAFTSRVANLEVTVEEARGGDFGELLDQRRADAPLAPRAGRLHHAVPFLRCRLVVVAAPGHRLAARRDVPAGALASERWLVGAGGADELERHGVVPDDVRAFGSEAAALTAAAAGEGIALAVLHTVADELRRKALVRLDVRGTPVTELWFASTLAADRALPAAVALQRFASTPEATQAMLTRRGGVPAARFRPPVHVTLWSSVAREVDGADAR